MNTRIHLITPLCLTLIAFTPSLRADGSKGDDHDRKHESEQRHDEKHEKRKPSNVIKVEARAVLTSSSTNATAGVSGTAALESEREDGEVEDEVKVRTRGLAADTYTVSVTKKSDGLSLVLGTFTISPTTPPVTGRAHQKKSCHRQGSIEFETDGDHPLPPDFDGLDVAAISVSDSTGNVVLAGEFTARVERVVRLTLTPGATSPNASGAVSTFTKTRAGVTSARFCLVAKGLPASATLTLAVNGADVQTVTTSTKGYLRVKSLPETVDISAITAVEIHDATPATLLSGSL